MSKNDNLDFIDEARKAAKSQEELLFDNSLANHIRYQSDAPAWGYALSLSKETDDFLRKVGDTHRGYHGIHKRLVEDWGWRFPEAHPVAAFPLMLDDNHFVRDYYLHDVLRDVLGKHNLAREELLEWFDGNKDAYSAEVFECNTEDVLTAWNYIRSLYESGAIDWSKVRSIKSTEKDVTDPVQITFRPLQQDAIDSYVNAVSNGRNHLLAYMCPRAGKTLTTFGCAEATGARSMLVTSAVASVLSEWRGATRNFSNFSDWMFIDAEALDSDPDIVGRLLDEGEKVAVFLTFQDIQGEELKERHSKLIDIKFDMNVRDETHIGARGAAFSAKLGNSNERAANGSSSMDSNVQPDIADEFDDNDFDEYSVDRKQADEMNSYVDAHFKFKTQLDLSGTPYNIMLTDEFSPDDIISQISYSDILHEKEKWYEDNPEAEPWENPYYDFPSLLTLGIVFDDEDSKLLSMMADENMGELTDIFDYEKDEDGKAYLLYPSLVHRFFAALDGTIPDSSIHAFLDNEVVCERIRNFQAFMIFSRKVQVDLVTDYLEEHKAEFKRFSSWRFFKATREGSYMSDGQIKSAVAESEKEGISTMTFTVRKMMTGMTVPQWNLGINARPSSASDSQFYDQSRSRLLSGFSEDIEILDSNGNVEKSGKRVLKSQSVFIDLAPNRLLEIEADKAQQYALAKDPDNGLTTRAVEDALEYELSVLPHVMMDNIAHIFKPVTPTDVLHVMTKCDERRSIIDQCRFVRTVNYEWRENDITGSFLNQMVARSCPDAKKMIFDAYIVEDENYSHLDEDDLESLIDLAEYAKMKNNECAESIAAAKEAAKELVGEEKKAELVRIKAEQEKLNELREKEKELERKFLEQQRQMIEKVNVYVWCASALYDIENYNDIVKSLRHKYNTKWKQCQEIAERLNMDAVLFDQIYKSARPADKIELNQMCYRMNALANDDALDDLEKIEALFSNFSRLGDSEIVTPEWVATKIVDVITDEDIADGVENGEQILGFADKIGEHVIALYVRMMELGYSEDEIARTISTIPCSKMAYVMIFRTFEMLGLDTRNIASHFTAYDIYDMLMKDEKDGGYGGNRAKIADALRTSNTGYLCDVVLDGKQSAEEKKKMAINFKAVVGNPPYQEKGEGNGRHPSIYDEFMDVCYELSDVVVLITPGRFLFNAGQTSKKWNKKMLDDEYLQVVYYEPKGANIFPGTDIKGGLAITKRNAQDKCGKIGTFTVFPILNNILRKVRKIEGDSLQGMDTQVSSQGIYHVTSLFFEQHPEAEEVNGKGTGTKIVSKLTEKLPDLFLKSKPTEGQYRGIHTRIKGQRDIRFIESQYLEQNEWLEFYSVLVPEANGSGALGEVMSSPFIGEPFIGHTDTFLSIGKYENKDEANACLSYIKSKFARVCLGSLKVTQHNPKATWSNVPLQDFTSDSDIDWSKSIADIDQQLYEKYGLTEEEIEFIEKNVKPME